VLAERPAHVSRQVRRRASRQRVARRRWGLIAAIVIALVAAAVLVSVLGSSGGRRAARAPAVATAQRTVLVGYGAPGKPAISAAVLGAVPADGQASAGPAGALLLLPASLADPGQGGTVGGAFAVADPQEFPASVAELLGVRIDETWRLTPDGLASLVDRLGGIGVEVDAPDPAAGLAAGSRRLNGAQAASYASFAAQGDSDLQRADRLRRVLNGVLAALPTDPSRLANSIGSLGAGSEVSAVGPTASSDPAAARAALAASLVAAAHSDVASHEQLVPTTPEATGYTLDKTAANGVTGQLFGGAQQTVAVGTRVEVVNDAGTPDLAASAGTRLRAARLVLVKAVNDQPFGQHPRSEVLVFDSAPASLDFGHRVAVALGIPAAPVVVSNQVSVVTDAIAVLGKDYRP
jgi:hypothetical protein